MLKEFQFWCIIFEEIKIIKKSFVFSSTTSVRDAFAFIAMSFELLSVEKSLITIVAGVKFAGLLVHAEQMLFEIITGCEGFGAEVALMIALVEVDAKNVTGNARLVAKTSVAPVADEFGCLVGSFDVCL